MHQNTVDHHCKYIREKIAAGKGVNIIWMVNYLKNHGSDPRTRNDWSWVGAQLVMSGWLTINELNDFELKT